MIATVIRDGIKLHYEGSGSGPAIVLTHSFLCDHSLFTHQVTALERTYRVINIDLRGHGRSDPSESPYTMYDLVDDVGAVLDAEGWYRQSGWACRSGDSSPSVPR